MATPKNDEKKEEKKQDNSTSWLALSTALMAVLAAITTMYMGKYSTRGVLMQGQETDQWAFYQAKSIKAHAYVMGQDELELAILRDGNRMSPKVLDEYKKTVAKYDENIQRYEKEKTEIKDKADRIAKDKIIAQQRGGNFGYALLFLQIAIMLSSISAITKKRGLWYFGLASTIGWLFYFINAIVLFMP